MSTPALWVKRLTHFVDSADEKNVWSLSLPEMRLSGKTIGDVLLDAVKLILYSNDLDEGLESRGDQLLVSWLGEWDLNRVLDVKIRRSNRIEMCRRLVEAYGCSLQAGEGCLIVRRVPTELAAGCGKF